MYFIKEVSFFKDSNRILKWNISIAGPSYLLDSLDGVEIFQQLLHDNRLQLLKALHCLAHKHQHIKCCLLITVTQEFHQLYRERNLFKLYFFFSLFYVHLQNNTGYCGRQ